MKIVLDLQNNPSENDIIVYTKGAWLCVNKDKVLDQLRQEINKLKQEKEKLEKDFQALKVAVNDKLKSYHDILQLMTKED